MKILGRPIVSSVIAVALMCGISGALRAQDTPSAISDLLRSAKDALNDLRFARADTIAREVLSRVQLRRSQSVLAWQIVAAANFPEEGTRDTAAAQSALREVIRLDLDATFPVDIRWSGLEVLLNAEKPHTMGMAVRIPRAETIYGGSAGDAILRAASSVPTNMWLVARADGASTQIVLDSATGVRDAAFRIPALRGTEPILPTGAYEFVVRATDPRSGVTLERVMQASVTAPKLDLAPVPTRVDTTRMLPEISKPNRSHGVAAGITFAVLTVAVGHFLRAPDPIKSSTSDGRATTVGIAIGLGTILAVYLDRGHPLPQNRISNAQLRSVNAKLIADATAENEKRVTGYRAKMTLLMEDK